MNLSMRSTFGFQRNGGRPAAPPTLWRKRHAAGHRNLSEIRGDLAVIRSQL
jgi:hypothetical protein